MQSYLAFLKMYLWPIVKMFFHRIAIYQKVWKISSLKSMSLLLMLPPTSHLSISRGFNVRVAFLTDDVVDVVQAVSRNVGKGSGTI